MLDTGFRRQRIDSAGALGYRRGAKLDSTLHAVRVMCRPLFVLTRDAFTANCGCHGRTARSSHKV